MEPAGTFGVPPVLRRGQEASGSILRSQVAEACVAALVEPAASCKVVEVVARDGVRQKSYEELFQSVA